MEAVTVRNLPYSHNLQAICEDESFKLEYGTFNTPQDYERCIVLAILLLDVAKAIEVANTKAHEATNILRARRARGWYPR